MNEAAGREKKIDIAKRVLTNLVQNMKSEGIKNISISLRIYGNYFNPQGTKEVACKDSTLEVPISGLNFEAMRLPWFKKLTQKAIHPLLIL